MSIKKSRTVMEENGFLKTSLNLLQNKSNLYLKAIIDIHNIKEPKQFVSIEDTLIMVKDLFDECKEESARANKLEDDVRKLEEKISFNNSLEIVYEENDLKLAIDRSEIAEKEIIQLLKLNERRGMALHPVLGSCDDEDSHVCSACIATKIVADSVEIRAQELLDLKKLIRRSELIMLRVAWNRKMQNKDEIESTEKEAQVIAEEMKIVTNNG